MQKFQTRNTIKGDNQMEIFEDHTHDCELKILFPKSCFECPNKVKYKNASHEDGCDFCKHFITIWFDDDNCITRFSRVSDKDIRGNNGTGIY